MLSPRPDRPDLDADTATAAATGANDCVVHTVVNSDDIVIVSVIAWQIYGDWAQGSDLQPRVEEKESFKRGGEGGFERRFHKSETQ